MSLYSDGTNLINFSGGVASTSALQFIPQSGFSGALSNGVLTVNGPSGSFGTKPVDPRPLLVMMVNAADGLNPSSLGRTTSLLGVAGLTAVSGGGPGNGPYAAGAPTTSADNISQVSWVAGFDIDQWGTGSPALNDFGSKYYFERQIWRSFPSYNESSQFAISNITWSSTNGGTATITTTDPLVIDPSVPNGLFQLTVQGCTPSGYNVNDIQNAFAASTNTITYPLATNPGTLVTPGTYSVPFNLKKLRFWSRNPDTVGSPQTYPDFIAASSNYNYTTEYGNVNLPDQPCPYTPVPQSWYTYQPYQDNVDAINGGPISAPNPLTYQNWAAETFEWRANLQSPSYTANGENFLDSNSLYLAWRSEGINNNNPALPTPLQTYQPNNWFVKGSDTGIDTGRMMRAYFWHVISEQYQGMLPIGSHIDYGPSIVEDSWCRIHARNSSTATAYTMMEFQIPSAWSDTSITMTLRQGRFSSGEQTPIIVTDNTGTEHYVGDIIWP